jgi:cell division protein FtsI/penicillin-binding protein 2
MKYGSFLFVVFFVVTSLCAQENPALQNLLEKRLQNCNCSAVMIDPNRGGVLASMNAEPILKEKHPPASLMKVFTLIAYAQNHGGKFPEYKCPPSLARDLNGCWDRNGHGTVNIQKAVAFSCNVYFKQLAAQTSPETFVDVLREFGISEPTEVTREMMIGKTMSWKVSPLQLLKAYSSIFNGATHLPSAELRSIIQKGLLEGAIHGTSTLARETAGVEMLGKTGTSLLITNGKIDYSRTQGWWIGLYPVEDPQIAIMTFVRNGRGASDAAPVGGQALATWLELRNGAQTSRLHQGPQTSRLHRGSRTSRPQ